MSDPTNQETRERLEQAFAQFQQENPAVVEAMQVMNITYSEYLQALAVLEERPSSSSSNIAEAA